MLAPVLLILAVVPVVRHQQPTGGLALETGVLSAPLTGRLEESTRRYALARRRDLAMPTSSTLGSAVAHGNRFGGAFHFAQEVGGVPVHQAKVVVTVDGERRVRSIASSVVSYASWMPAWKLSSTDALERAANAIDGALLDERGRPYGGTSRRYFPVGRSLHAGYWVFVPTIDAAASWHVAIDATNGEVLWTENRVFHADTAKVYQNTLGGIGAGVGSAALSEVTLLELRADRVGGFLHGEHLTTYNCCPNKDCAPTGTARRSTGTMSWGGTPVPFNIAICDRMPIATNDSFLHRTGDYVYTPVDPPTSVRVSQAEPADSDAFAEVHAYHHATALYRYVRGISASPLTEGTPLAPFQTRDERDGRVPAVWVNVTMPHQGAAHFVNNTFTIDRLMRFDNAAFVLRESFPDLQIPEYILDVDTLMMFQGTQADTAYDATVTWHESGHGVVASTAMLDAFTIDARGGNAEGGAMNEGFADYFAGALGNTSMIGPYFGPRSPDRGKSIRDMNNAYRCPTVLTGEVHIDSQHFSAALWEARREVFQGTDQGRTFDAAIYAALTAMSPATTFEDAGQLISTYVVQAFPGMGDAKELIDAILRRRGVVGCSKVIDVDDPDRAEMFNVFGHGDAKLSAGVVPAPYQLRITAPAGARAINLSGETGWGPTQLKLLLKVGSPVRFSQPAPGNVTHDADDTVPFTAAKGVMSVSATVEVPCGGELYLAIANAGERAEAVARLAADIAPLESCPSPSAVEPTPQGKPQPASGEAMGSTPSIDEGGGGDVRGDRGCGCGGSGDSQTLVGLAALLTLLVRRKRSGVVS